MRSVEEGGGIGWGGGGHAFHFHLFIEKSLHNQCFV